VTWTCEAAEICTTEQHAAADAEASRIGLATESCSQHNIASSLQQKKTSQYRIAWICGHQKKLLQISTGWRIKSGNPTVFLTINVRKNLVPDTLSADGEGALPELGPCRHDNSCVGCRGTELATSMFFLLTSGTGFSHSSDDLFVFGNHLDTVIHYRSH